VQPISTFGYDDSMGRYLRSDRSDVADAAIAEYLTGDEKFMLILNCILTKRDQSFGIGAAFKRTFHSDLATPISKKKLSITGH
jgi:hypothetical protein